LEQTVLDIKFTNPIGLAAGFDKNAEITDIRLTWVSVSRSWVPLTGEPCPGNPKKSFGACLNRKSLIVYYGLKNDGCEVIARRLKRQKIPHPHRRQRGQDE